MDITIAILFTTLISYGPYRKYQRTIFDAITLINITHNCILPELTKKKKKKEIPKCVCTETFSPLSISQRMTWKQTKTKKENKRNKHKNNSFFFSSRLFKLYVKEGGWEGDYSATRHAKQ